MGLLSGERHLRLAVPRPGRITDSNPGRRVDVTRTNVPARSRDLYRRARHVLAQACARLDLDSSGAELLG
jgi:hypothetical protein